jgi:hypothetical protein
LTNATLKDRSKLEGKRIEAEQDRDSHPEDPGSYRRKVSDAYTEILSQWDEFIFLVQSDLISDKKLIKKYTLLFEMDKERAVSI